MSYNEAHFDTALNAHLRKKLETLLLWQSHVLEFMRDYLVASNDQQQIKHCAAFLQLLVKMRFNVESTNLLIPTLYRDYRFKTSINVIYRTIVDDIINSYYLFGMVALADPDQEALGNELNILHKEYILGTTEGATADKKFQNYVDALKQQSPTPDEDVDALFKNANPELVDPDGHWKKNKDIRATTHQFFIDNLNQGNSNGFVSEKKKLEFIEARGVVTHDNIKALFKYFSQYQHFSPKAHDLLLHHIEADIIFYQRTLGELVMLLDQLTVFLELKGKAEIKKNWDALAKNVFDSYSE